MRLARFRNFGYSTGSLRIAASVLTLLTVACASSSTQLADLESSVSAVERRLDELRSQTPTREDLATVIRALESLGNSDVTANADLKEDLRQILSELEALRNLTQEQRQILSATVERLEQTGTDVALIQGRLEGQEATLDQLLEASLAPAVETVDPKAIYDAAYRDYTDGRYELAITGFRHYLDTFPEGLDAGSAQYWLGESHLGLGQFQLAVDELTAVRERYPESDKVASSLFKVGVALVELGERELAIEMFLRVRSSYPDMDEAALALQELDSLGAEQ